MSKSLENDEQVRRKLEDTVRQLLMTTDSVYEFGPFRVDVGKRVLMRGSEAISLTPKAFELLVLMVRSQGRALSKRELMSKLWPDTFVEEANLTFQVATVRRALGEAGAEWIETVPKHGYRFTAPVSEVNEFFGTTASANGAGDAQRELVGAGLKPAPTMRT